MPDKDGLTAVREIRSASKLNRNIPVIALTALAFPEDREQCMNAGMNDYISKPFTKGKLISTARKYIK